MAVTLSAPTRTIGRSFWGPFQGSETVVLGPDSTTLSFTTPPRIRALRSEVTANAIDPRVCRLRFEPTAPVALHNVEDSCRPPTDGERPNRRYLAYGTSITEGEAASAAHLSYVSRVARRCRLDALNLGVSGSAFCEPAVARYIAGRKDWDIATLSINMANRGFTVEQFGQRVEAMIDIIANAAPGRPVVCVTLFPHHADLVTNGNSERAAAFRNALRDAAADHDSVSVVEGPEVMEADGLTTDLLHPGDAGMARIGCGLADRLTEV